MKTVFITICTLLISTPCLDGIKQNNITCTDNSCYGSYKGPEFINRDDIAHQFSNKMSSSVGDQLKKLYHQEKYSKVDFNGIEMTTLGMGSGTVTYYLKIPFKRVSTKCEAFISFDHVGGWNHTPALEARKKQLSKALIQNERLEVSTLKLRQKVCKNIGFNGRIKRLSQYANRNNLSSYIVLRTFRNMNPFIISSINLG